jgi:hypothetical protein
MKLMTDEARAAIAMGWLNSSLTQEEWAKQHSVSVRSLRSWVRRFGPPRPHRQEQADLPGYADASRALPGDLNHLRGQVDQLQTEVDAVRALMELLEHGPAGHPNSHKQGLPRAVLDSDGEGVPAGDGADGLLQLASPRAGLELLPTPKGLQGPVELILPKPMPTPDQMFWL